MMTTTKTLEHQTKDAYHWIEKLITSVPESQWDETPEVLATNMSWQVGHLIISIYYHSILVISGHHSKLLETLHLKLYSDLCNYNTSPTDITSEIDPTRMKEDLKYICETSLEILQTLSEKDLHTPLVPYKIKHPVASTKFEAIDWNIKHTMWHVGQLATLRRILGHPVAFTIQPDS